MNLSNPFRVESNWWFLFPGVLRRAKLSTTFGVPRPRQRTIESSPGFQAWVRRCGSPTVRKGVESQNRVRPRQRTIESSPGFQAWVNDEY